MTYPVKWTKGQSSGGGLLNRVKFKLVLSFLGTVFIPLLYLLNLWIIAVTPFSLNLMFPVILSGLLIALFGIIFWIISFINLGTSFGVLPQKQKRVKRGLYKHLNHPMYIGIYATFFGLSITNGSWQGLTFLNLILLPILFARAILEERNLN